MAKKFITLVNGLQHLIPSIDTSAGASSAGEILAADENGKLNPSFLPVGVGADNASLPATEALAAGDFVNIYDATGTPSCRKASGVDNTKPAHGFVKSDYSDGAVALVYFEGEAPLTGLTVGTKYFLSSTTAGGVTATAPSANGNMIQYLGTARSTTLLRFDPELGTEIG